MLWTPIGEDPLTHHTLVPGIPAYMRGSLREWFSSEFNYFSSSGHAADVKKRMRRYDLDSKGQPHADDLSHGPDAVFQFLTDDEIIRIMDWVVRDNADDDCDSGDLEEILRAGSSLWKVGMRDGLAGLERRVPEGVQDAADAAMAAPGHAGSLLSEAWHAAFGVDPNPETAYRKAVLAVEAAAIPVVTFTDRTATLGKVFSVMRDQGDWGLDIAKQHTDHPTNKVLLGMVQMLWAGQGRHAGQPDWTPNTQTEAEAAVMLAVPLVQWFSSGAIARRP